MQSSDPAQTLARIRRDLYGLLSSLYIQIPDKKILGLKWEPAAELLRYPHDGSEEALKKVHEGLSLVKPYGSEKNLKDEKILTSLAKDWTYLFRGTDRKGILPPYESLYRTGKLQEKPAQEMHRLFSEMGIRTPDEWHQPPDYIGVELDFMRLLCEKEIEAREQQHLNSIRETIEIERSFLENHLSQWLPVFCEKMFARAHEDLYRGIARLSIGLVQYDRTYMKNILLNCRSQMSNSK